MSIVINMESVELGKNDNHLLLKGYIPAFSNVYLYEFDFIGTEVTSTAPLDKKQLKRLKEELVKDYGYASFTEKKAKQALEKNRQYKIRE